MICREPHTSRRLPFRIGLVLDEPADADARRDVVDALRFSFDEATQTKRLDRPVELLVREVTSPAAALAAWRELVADDAEIVLGPHGDDAALAVAEAMKATPHPTISACATDRFSSEYGITLGPRDEAAPNILLARDLAEIVVQALATAKPHNPEGIRNALDRIRFVPAACGPAGTIISIGPFDHRAYKCGSTNDAAAPVMQARAATSAPPYRIGVIQDWALGTEAWFDQFDMTELAFREATEDGILDRPVELVVREIEGPPFGPTARVVAAWKELALEEGCLGVIGPHITDDARTVRAVVDAHRVPTLTYCATLLAASEYVFQLPNGTFADETGYLARHLAAAGARRVGIIREDNAISDEYADFFRMYLRRHSIAVASDQIIHGFASEEEVIGRLAAIRDAGADAIAYLAFGITSYNVMVKGNEAMRSWGWDPIRGTITTWVSVTCPGFRYHPQEIYRNPALVEGWVGVDQTHEGNRTWAAVRERFAHRFDGRKPFHCYAALGWDMGHALALALSRAVEKTPEGVKQALETIRLLPAACGGPGTIVSFAPHDRRGFKGADYLVLRTVKDGKEQLA